MSYVARAVAFWLTPVSLLASCVTAPPALDEQTVLTDNTSTITGRFSARGEWTVFGEKDSKEYIPYSRSENQKCISVANGTGQSRSRFDILNGEHVIIRGYTIKYFALDKGSSPADIALSMRYFNGDPVHNFCIREYVFVAQSIERGTDN